MSQGGEGKGKRVFEVQTMISVQNNSEKTTGTGTGLRSRGKTQKRKKKKIDEPSELSGSLGTREKGPRDLLPLKCRCK